MSLSATLVFSIGSIIGKALLKILLDDRPLPERALAVACLETAVKVDPALRQRVFAAVPELFPPYLPASQQMLAAAGEHAIPYLVRERQPNIAAMVVCIRTLALIGGERALAAIEGYSELDLDKVRYAIDAAWLGFDHAEYARRLLKQRLEIFVYDSSLVPMLAQLPQLRSLALDGTQASDLSVLAQLPQLQSLSLDGMQASDFSVLAQLPHLEELYV